MKITFSGFPGLVGLLVLAVVAIVVSNARCHAIWGDLYERVEWGVLTGCRVLIDDRLTPAHVLRDLLDRGL